jgi:hypothetical protein
MSVKNIEFGFMNLIDFVFAAFKKEKILNVDELQFQPIGNLCGVQWHTWSIHSGPSSLCTINHSVNSIFKQIFLLTQMNYLGQAI